MPNATPSSQVDGQPHFNSPPRPGERPPQTVFLVAEQTGGGLGGAPYTTCAPNQGWVSGVYKYLGCPMPGTATFCYANRRVNYRELSPKVNSKSPGTPMQPRLTAGAVPWSMAGPLLCSVTRSVQRGCGAVDDAVNVSGSTHEIRNTER
ncbi:hypothetical protein NDU88_002865 [Pleurodeles waltl]|uniref:Uncharacterized protein n=1 Tax=Pleurodeles waltl TaxID=8319 RepID=A0AAV7V024_PLEWA|nr:hypothetical protein NDU88_002865 [Pleurodeles waltl]